MTQRILGEPGPKRKRRTRLLPLLMLFAAILLIGASQASGAFGTATPDEDGANDVPGQKDLTSQNLDDSGLPDSIRTQWNWDELSTSGNNTLDACSLLDSDDDGFANFAVCATTKGTATNPITTTTTVYSCGDTRVDRCSSQLAVITTATSACTSAVSDTDPFAGPPAKLRGANYPNDLQATCDIDLDDFGVTVTDLDLINTCSYPSQQPNSDPSDCVLIPRDAFLLIIKDAGDDPQAFDFTVSGGGSFSGQVSDDGVGETVAIVSNTATTVTEGATPTGWNFGSASCTGSTITGGNGTPSGQSVTGVKAAIGETVTCTFVNTLALVDPDLSTSPSVVPQDSATIAIDESGDGTGDLIFELYDNDTCTGTALYSQTFTDIGADATKTTTNSGDPAVSSGYTITASDIYYWKVRYEGDNRNNPATSDCVENIDVTLTGDSG
jgi:hypothetical protein